MVKDGKAVLLRVVPESVKARARRVMFSEVTVSQGWDRWARFQSEVGDAWTNPRQVGMDISAEEMLPYLDREVFAPFLGTPEVLLEIGSGGGRFTELLLPKCQRLIAVDTSKNMLKLLQKRFGPEKIDYVLGDGKGLSPVPNVSVDAAFSYGTFVHIQQWDIFNYLRELRRVLKPDGRALIHHANTFSELGWEHFIRDMEGCVGTHKDWGSFSVMTPEIMREFVERAGLRLLDARTDIASRDCISFIEAP